MQITRDLHRQHAEAVAEITDLLRQVERVKSALIEAEEAAATGRYMAGEQHSADKRRWASAFGKLANAVQAVIADELSDAHCEITKRPRELVERICALDADAEIAQHRADYYQEAI